MREVERVKMKKKGGIVSDDRSSGKSYSGLRLLSVYVSTWVLPRAMEAR